MSPDEETIFFDSPAAFYNWLSEHHETTQEQWVGYYKKHTNKPSMTWPESVDQALCFGWIDGLRRSVDEDRYRIRFTPRKATSIWSDVNVKRYAELLEEKKIQPAGKAAYARKKADKAGLYSFEQDPKSIVLPPNFESLIKKNKAAWAFFQKLTPSVFKASVWWVISAKQEATRQRRLEEFIQSCAEGKKIKMLRRKGE